MATRFYFDITDAPAPGAAFSGAPTDAGWEQSAGAAYTAGPGTLTPKQQMIRPSGLFTQASNVPITTTQDIAYKQFLSPPLTTGGLISGTFSFVMGVLQAATTNNVTLAMSVRIVSGDRSTIRGTLYSTFSIDTAFAVTQATRIVNAAAITPQTAQRGDRIVIEIGGHAAAPSTSGSFSMRTSFSSGADFALTTALATDLNPWCEFSQDLFGPLSNNYQQFKVGDGMSVSEKIR